MSHRIVLDLETKTVVAEQDRSYHRWTPMCLQHVAYMEQILDKTFGDIFGDPEQYSLVRVDEVPTWALQAWDWPRDEEGEIYSPVRSRAGRRPTSIAP
ncbi:hypothetical protein B0G84_7503 [Paraburkholderia sp. BL8N3]|nr:hypothetical protein [Paraburkholderia sp. BL8N3]TCK33300.1 hypothetical protein B0G84_7503 [Paraburkholderia sp. BL8N3]